MFTGKIILAEPFHHIPMADSCRPIKHCSIILLHIFGKWSHIGHNGGSILPKQWQQDQMPFAFGTDEAFTVQRSGVAVNPGDKGDTTAQ